MAFYLGLTALAVLVGAALWVMIPLIFKYGGGPRP